MAWRVGAARPILRECLCERKVSGLVRTPCLCCLLLHPVGVATLWPRRARARSLLVASLAKGRGHEFTSWGLPRPASRPAQSPVSLHCQLLTRS